MSRFTIVAMVMLCLSMGGCFSKYSKSVVNPTQLQKGSSSDIYHIRTRIVVEDEATRDARDFTKIAADIWYAEHIYKPLGIKFVIVEMVAAAPNQDWYGYIEEDASKYPNTLSIYYAFNRPTLTIGHNVVGVSNFPWTEYSCGVVLCGPSIDGTTLAHEVGHYFGLYHTFGGLDTEDDFVDDTYNREEYAEKEGEDSHYGKYNNIMNYHAFGRNSFVTEGQIDRIGTTSLLLEETI